MLRATLKGLLAHKLRMALTALAVVLGVGFIAGTYVLTDTMNKTFDDLFVQANAGIDVIVRNKQSFQPIQGPEQRSPLDDALVDRIEAIEGVEDLEATVTGYAQIVDLEGEPIAPFGPPTLGVSWSGQEGGPLEIREGRAASGPGEVAVDAGTIENNGLAVGDRVRILFETGSGEFEIVGKLGFGEADNLAGATLAVFDLETAQTRLGKEGLVDAIEVVADDGVSAATLRAQIAAVLPPRAEAVTADSAAQEQADAIQQGLGFLNTALLVFASVALFVGAFIIFNTFSIVVAQRTREFALLRALGASPRQIMTSVVIEAALVGFVASAIGLGAGLLIALGLKSLMNAIGIDLPSTTLQLLPRTIVVSLVVGTLVTLVSSIVPARKAARISPMEALRDSMPQPYEGSARRGIIGGLITVAGAGLLFLGLFGSTESGLELVGAGAFVTLLGVAVLSPVFAAPISRFLGAPLPSMLHVPGTLARENAARNPKRTAATAAALMIGLALISFTAILTASLKESARSVLGEVVKADLVLSSGAIQGTVRFSPKVAELTEEAEGVATVAQTRLAEFRHEGKTWILIAVDTADLGEVVSIGTEEEAAALVGLDADSVLIYDETAKDLGVEVGDSIEMQFASTGKQPFEVAGLFSRREAVSDFLVSLEAYEANYPETLDDIVYVDVAGGFETAEVQANIQDAISDFPGINVLNQSEFREETLAAIDQFLALVYALLALALVIALLGITNTLALSVFERTREIGLLRAIGMMRRQTRAMIRWESVIVSVMGALLGILVGAFFGWALVQALAEQGVEKLKFPVGQLIGFVAAAGIAGIAAAVPPARRAARLNVLEAIAAD
jgi:putative ABC transport system permease protein